MLDVNVSTIENLKAWIAGRKGPGNDTERATISAPDALRSIGFGDLTLPKAGPEHQETIVSSHDFSTQKPKTWTELSHLVSWSSEFINSLKNNKSTLATLELIRGANDFPITIARFHVDESINVVSSALCFEVGLEMHHPDTRGQNYAVNNIMIEESTCLQEIVRQVFTCLFSKCVVRLVVKTNNFYSAAITVFLVDLMHASGATKDEVECVAFDRRESIGNEQFSKPPTPNKNSKLSVIATVFRQTDTFAAAQGIIDSYFREQYQNLIVLTEESVYDRFIQDWQRYYSHAIKIGPRLDDKTTIVDSFNEKVQIDLAAIDMKASHKMSGYAINILRFRTLNELSTLLNSLRKVPYMTIWNDDIILSREFCLRLNQCNEFWLNHVPHNIAGRKFPEDMLNYYYDVVSEDMTYIYNSVYSQFPDEAEQVRKTQSIFVKKDIRVRTSLLLQAFVSLVSKYKSLKVGSTITESLARLKRFQLGCMNRVHCLETGESRIETQLRPVGLAIFFVRDENTVKNKPVIVEFIFKNLILGNGVLLVCPHNFLGVKFSIDNDHVIPFKMVHDALPDISRLSLDNSIEASENSFNKKQCPKNTFAVEILPEMTSESCETMTIALGSKRRHIWYPDVEQANYWSNE